LLHANFKGAKFYGKRKSDFYGQSDDMKKADPNSEDAEEDYQGPTGTGYFVWRKNEEGKLQPQTRLQGKSLERLIKPKTSTATNLSNNN